MSFKKQLSLKINNKTAKIGIIGLGYVGLPLAIAFSRKKYFVIGFDLDKSKIKKLKKSQSYLGHISNSSLKKIRYGSYFTFKVEVIKKADIIILCLPTPLKNNNEPDLSYLKNTIKNIRKYLIKGQLIIIESSTYPGSTKELLEPIVKKKKFTVGKDFFIGYSPEREDPNNKKFTLEKIPKIVSGYTKDCLGLTKNIYSKIINRVVKVDNIETAEFTKLFENTYRSINIALVNELKILAKKTNLDINQIISAAKTKPFGFQAFMPGPGVGGHCIPVDPYYLNWFANRNKIKLKFIEHAGIINKLMPKWIIKESEKIKKIKRALILGITYKKNISDTRESPAIDFIKILTKKKIKVDYHDPFAQVLKTRKLKKIFKSVNLKNIKNYDIVYLLTDHDCLNYEYIKKNSKLIIDTRNIYKNEINNKIVKL